MKHIMKNPLSKRFAVLIAAILSCLSALAQIDMESLDPESSILFLVKPTANTGWLPFNGNAKELMQVQLAIDKSHQRVFVAYGDVHDKGARYTCSNFHVSKDTKGNAVVYFKFNDHRLIIWSGHEQCSIILDNKQSGSLKKYSTFIENEEWLRAVMPADIDVNYNAADKMIRLINILHKAKNLGIIKYLDD